MEGAIGMEILETEDDTSNEEAGLFFCKETSSTHMKT